LLEQIELYSLYRVKAQKGKIYYGIKESSFSED